MTLYKYTYTLFVLINSYFRIDIFGLFDLFGLVLLFCFFLAAL